MSSRAAIWRSVRPTALVLAIAPVVGLALVVVASFVPDAWILGNLVSGLDAGHFSSAQYGFATTGRYMDYFTDCIGTTIGLGDQAGANPFTNAIRSPTLGSCESTATQVAAYRDGLGLEARWEYFRYWHGYAIVTRPLLATVGLAGARMVMIWAIIAGAIGLGRQLLRTHGPVVAVALLAPTLLTTDLIELPRSLPHACGALAALVTAWIAHRVVTRTADVPMIAAVGAAAGATFLFFDILTITPGAWALLGGVVALAASSSYTGRALAGRIVAAAGGWMLGWAAMWVSKWVFASFVYGPTAVREQIGDVAGRRVDGGVDYLDFAFGRSIRLTFDTWMDHPLTPWMLGGLALLVAFAWSARWADPRVRPLDRLLLAAPAVLPLLWFEVMRNHTQVHAGFTYRSWGVVAGVIAAALVVRLHAIEPDAVSATTADGVGDDAEMSAGERVER